MRIASKLVAAALFSLCLSAWGQQPARIVSTFPSATETVFALGAGNRVVGVSTYCRYPPAVLALPKVGTYIKPDAEKIVLLHPDMVILDAAATNLADRLSAIGIRHIEVKVGSLAEVYLMIESIGKAIGETANASQLNSKIRSRLDALRAESRNQPKPKVLMVVGRTPGLLTNLIGVGPSTYLGELLDIAGGANVLAGSAIAYPRISMETVVRTDPDVILDMSMMGEAGADLAPFETSLRKPWLEHRELRAVRSDAVYGLGAEMLVTPGPRVADVVELLRNKIRARSVR